MTKDEIFAILHKPRNLQRKIKDCKREIKNCDFMAINIKSCISNGIHVQTNKTAFEFWIDKKTVYENTLNILNNNLEEADNKVENLIKCLEPTEYVILKLYYIDGLSWREISEEVNYSFSHCRKIANKGKDNLINKMTH